VASMAVRRHVRIVACGVNHSFGGGGWLWRNGTNATKNQEDNTGRLRILHGYRLLDSSMNEDLIVMILHLSKEKMFDRARWQIACMSYNAFGSQNTVIYYNKEESKKMNK